MYEYNSKFAAKIHDLLNFRKSIGLAIDTYAYNLSLFDKYCNAYYPEENILTAQIVNSWIDYEIGCNRGGLRDKSIDIRYFGRYLSSLGEDAFILPAKLIPKLNTYSPYILSDDELSDLFKEIDVYFCSVYYCHQDYLLKQHVFSVLFRLIYTCGLRPGEGIELAKKDVNIQTGEIFLRKTKHYKERIIVVSDDMLSLLREYCTFLNAYFPDSEYFFPNEDGKPYKAERVQYYFRKCWSKSFHSKNSGEPPRLRIYDLRHRFATTVLHNWLDEGKNIYSMIPYLRTYMGHAKLEETLYYVHLLPENLKKSDKIDWAKLNSIIPEVTYE